MHVWQEPRLWNNVFLHLSYGWRVYLYGIPPFYALPPVAGTCAVYQSWVNFHAANAANIAFPGYAVVKPFTKVCGEDVMATLKEVAERAGVSQSTVSRLLNDPSFSIKEETHVGACCACARSWGTATCSVPRLRCWMRLRPGRNCRMRISPICGRFLRSVRSRWNWTIPHPSAPYMS